jgi:hypothetical protein
VVNASRPLCGAIFADPAGTTRPNKQSSFGLLALFASSNQNPKIVIVAVREGVKSKPMWLCIFLCTSFEDTYENPQWRKVEQMQPM